MMPAWLNPAGGIRYHLRARRRRRSWAPYHAALSDWLSAFEPSAPRAILVGPSAGYGFPDAFLAQFEEMVVLEPDPVARFLFGRRLRALGIPRIRFEARDLLVAPLLTGKSGLPELLGADGEACLIFGSVLGQARFLVPDADFARWKENFRARVEPRLGTRAWLSFHDRLSGSLAPSTGASYLAPARLDDGEVLARFYAAPPLRARSFELFDHGSGGLFPRDLPHTYFSWQIDAGRFHLMEAVRATRGSPALPAR